MISTATGMWTAPTWRLSQPVCRAERFTCLSSGAERTTFVLGIEVKPLSPIRCVSGDDGNSVQHGAREVLVAEQRAGGQHFRFAEPARKQAPRHVFGHHDL